MTQTLDWRTRYGALLRWLSEHKRPQWRDQVAERLEHSFELKPHGDLPRWLDALAQFPAIPNVTADFTSPAVRVESPDVDAATQTQVEKALRGLMPWRKGPFHFFGVDVDTEWRSDWKWERVQPYLSPLHGRRVLDVGCGSGYHCWRMLGEGASRVIGIDPGILFLMQFLAVRDYLDPEPPVDLLPLRMEELPHNLALFDTVFSLGVLYHRRSPIDHLLELKSALRPGGEVVLETLVIRGEQGDTLMPEDRYARMRNVWFIPSVATLERWMQRAGFRDVRAVDVTPTTTDEQRATDWMQFQSLPDFLDPEDDGRTIEGYPGPIRATLVARRAG